MRFLIAAMAIVLLTVTAHAQGMGRSHKGELKALEDAYKNTLKSIPESKINLFDLAATKAARILPHEMDA